MAATSEKAADPSRRKTVDSGIGSTPHSGKEPRFLVSAYLAWPCRQGDRLSCRHCLGSGVQMASFTAVKANQ
jgi:hypothetical protein